MIFLLKIRRVENPALQGEFSIHKNPRIFGTENCFSIFLSRKPHDQKPLPLGRGLVRFSLFAVSSCAQKSADINILSDTKSLCK